MDNLDITQKERKQKYNKERYEQNKDKMKEASKIWYIKKISETPEYRDVLKEKTRNRQQKLNEGIEPRPKGRPKTSESKEKKPNGRPRKYNIIL